MDQSPSEPVAPIKFRPSKKRKAYRQRDDHSPDQTNNQPTTTTSINSPPTENHIPDEESAVTAALRLRNVRKARLRGVGFSSDPPADDHTLPSNALVKIDTEEDRLAAMKGIPDRFMHQTGLVSTLNDKYMNEYIESRLSSRAEGPSQADRSDIHETPQSGIDADPTADQPTKHGKLVEVDVPLDMRHHGKRKMGSDSPRPKRGRNRRGSDDIKRDQLVEAFLHENKLDVYDVPVQNTPATTGDNLSADDRMAEEFRQRYLDEVAARRQKKRPVAATKQQQQQAGDVLKGPRLGGSRNQRAAVRDILLKQEKEKGGKRF